jgi:phosphoserine aminotransferase
VAKGTPSVMDYKAQADADSMLNTCATYPIYVAGLVFKWLKQQGGLSGMEQKNIEKAKTLYDFLDASAFFHNPVAKEDRSRMNVPFTLKDAKLDEEFLKGAAKAGSSWSRT